MIVKETYSPKIIENIDFEDIAKFAERMTLENCKIFLGGKDLLSKQEIVNGFESISAQKKEPWFKTIYQIHQKPVDDIKSL